MLRIGKTIRMTEYVIYTDCFMVKNVIGITYIKTYFINYLVYVIKSRSTSYPVIRNCNSTCAKLMFHVM